MSSRMELRYVSCYTYSLYDASQGITAEKDDGLYFTHLQFHRTLR